MKFLYKYFSSTGDWAHREQANYAIKILKLLKIKNNIIDLGCGDGKLSEKIKNALKARNFVGVDASKYYKKLIENRGIDFIKKDLNSSLNIHNKFDAAISFQTIEHIVNINVFLKEIAKIVKRNKPFIVTTENLASWNNVFALIWGIQPFTGPYLDKTNPIGWHPLNKFKHNKKPNGNKRLNTYPHVNVMTTKALVDILNRNEFKVTNVYGMGYYPLPVFLGNLLSKIDPYHSAYCAVVAIRK